MVQQQYSSLQQLQTRNDNMNIQFNTAKTQNVVKQIANYNSVQGEGQGNQNQLINIIKQLEIRQMSQDSHKSGNSLNSQQDAMMQEQHRKRLVALAQAQQQQILAAAKNRTINTNTNIQNAELNRNNSDMNFSNDVNVLNKKMINLRSQSKSGEKKQKIEFRNSKNKNKDPISAAQKNIKVQMNKTQPFNPLNNGQND